MHECKSCQINFKRDKNKKSEYTFPTDIPISDKMKEVVSGIVNKKGKK